MGAVLLASARAIINSVRKQKKQDVIALKACSVTGDSRRTMAHVKPLELVFRHVDLLFLIQILSKSAWKMLKLCELCREPPPNIDFVWSTLQENTGNILPNA